MNLLIIRHGIAEDRDAFARTGHPDHERPLTREGRKRMRDAAAGLAAVVPAVDLLGSSPYVRARETAEIVAGAYPDLTVIETPTLAETGTRSALEWIRTRAQVETLAVVGHEPHLSTLAGLLITGADKPIFSFKKGGACLIAFPDEPGPGQGELNWLLTPKQLRRLGPA